MRNPKYYQLFNEKECFVGIKRVTVDFLPAGANVWQLNEIEHDPDQSVNLSKPPLGIANLKRQKIGEQND